MKAKIHPKYTATKMKCSCGNVIETGSILGEEYNVEICSGCHPFFTGKQKIIDTAGRIEKFNKKFGNMALGGKKK